MGRNIQSMELPHFEMGNASSNPSAIFEYETNMNEEHNEITDPLNCAAELSAYLRECTQKIHGLSIEAPEKKRIIKRYSSIELPNAGISGVLSGIKFQYSLTKLVLNNNMISYLPKEIGMLYVLKELNLQDNRICYIPSTFGNLTNLKLLSLSGNRLGRLGSYIEKLKNLKSFGCARNKLEEIPSEIASLTKLESIDVSANPIRYLPEEITRLHHLQLLFADNCAFSRNVHITAQFGVPTLRELTSRTIMRMRLDINLVGGQYKKELLDFHRCTLCSGPYYRHYHSRIRFVLKNDKIYPLEARLCVDHYRTDTKRILKLFEPLPETAFVAPESHVRRNRAQSAMGLDQTQLNLNMPRSSSQATMFDHSIARESKRNMFQRMSFRPNYQSRERSN